MKEALFYEKLAGAVVRCRLCPQECRIQPGARGVCGVRRNEGGVLYLSTYGEVAADGMDPVEKKPLYHFHPGSWIYSLAAYGCNLRCRWCQNWRLSQGDGPSTPATPEEAVAVVTRSRGRGTPCVGLAYTYSEPLVWYEFVHDTAKLARDRGYANVLVTNGYVLEEPLRRLLPHVDALNVDVKGFRDAFYRRWCGGKRAPVLRTVEIAHAAGCHVELTCLLIPGLNDSEEEVDDLVSWLADLDPGIPLHLSRYFPSHRMSAPATPMAILRRAADQAMRQLHYVYLGNVWEPGGSDTFCPRCKTKVIERTGHAIKACRLEEDRCAACGERIRLVGRVTIEKATRGEELEEEV